MPVRHHHQVAVVVGIEVEDDEAGRAAGQDERLAASSACSASQKTQPLRARRCRSRRRAATETTGVPRRLPPSIGRPRGHEQRRRRAAGAWAAGSDARRGGFAVDQFLQFLAGLEVGHLLRRHVHLVAGLRVAPLARLPLAQPEAAEPPQLDLLAALQRVMMLLNTVSTMTSECFLVRSETCETSSTSSALVMLPPGVTASLLL